MEPRPLVLSMTEDITTQAPLLRNSVSHSASSGALIFSQQAYWSVLMLQILTLSCLPTEAKM